MTPTDAELTAAEAATRAMLAHYAEPQPLAAPPDLAARVLAALPPAPARVPTPRPALRARSWPRSGAAFALAATLLLFVLGGWGLYGLVPALRGDDELALARSPLTASIASLLGRATVTRHLAPPRALIVALLSMAGLAFSSAVAVAWPRRTRGVALVLRQASARALALGLLTSLLAGLALLLLSGLAALSPLWLALLLPLTLLLQLPYLVGLAALGDALSTLLGLRLAPPASSVLGTAILLLALAILALGLPLLSLALFYLGAACGLGAAIISRAGTEAC
jgi:hypothetical protein